MKTIKLQAAPIAHIFLALQALLFLPNLDHKEFIVGTCLPDARYKLGLNRQATHLDSVSWNDVVHAKTPFDAGMKFHSLVDLARDEHLVKTGTYEKINNNVVVHTALKLYEDQELAGRFDPTRFREMFFEEFPEGLKHFIQQHNVSEEAVSEWNHAIGEYISSTPSDKTNEQFISRTFGGKNITAIADTVNLSIEGLHARPALCQSIMSFYNSFMGDALDDPDKSEFKTFLGEYPEKLAEFNAGAVV